MLVVKKQRPSLDQLRTFLLVYRGGSFTDAARQLDISQPTVTNHMAVLEKWFGKELFARTAQGVTPTILGHSLAEALADPLDQIDRYFLEDQEAEHLLRTVSLGGPLEYLVHCVIPALGADAGRLPNLELRFGQSKALLAELESGLIDLVFSTVRPRDPELAAWPIADEEFWLVAAPTMNLPVGSLSQLSAAPTLAFNGELAIIRRYWNTMFHAEPNFAPAAIIPDLTALKAAVLAGLGVTVLPSYLVAEEVADGRLVRLNADAEAPINTIFLVAAKLAMVRRRDVAGMVNLLRLRIKEHQDRAEPRPGGDAGLAELVAEDVALGD